MTRILPHAVARLSAVYRRMLAVFLAIIGPTAAYAIVAFLARLLYRSAEPLRVRSEAQCQAALGKLVGDAAIARLAERAFVHRMWNLADLMLAARFLHPNTYHRYGGRIPEPHLEKLLQAQRNRDPVILVTAYYGPYDLLPVFLGYNGLQASVVYRPHGDPYFDAFRQRVRGLGGCEFVPVRQAAQRCGQILGSGGTIAIVADHHAEHRRFPVTFLGLPTTASRSVGLLAWRFSATVVVAGIRRRSNAFRFDLVIPDIIECRDWQTADDPVAYITTRYLRGLEQLILGDPAQYLWTHLRWGEDPVRPLINEHPAEREVEA